MRGRIRTVKPDVFKDEELWDLEVATGLPVFRAFQGLWCFADREGRFEWRPRSLKSDVLPYWDGDFAAVLDALASKGFITRYTVDGRSYGHVTNLATHQRFDHREPASTLPAPPDPGTPGQSSAAPESEHGHAQVEGKGRELEGNRKGREGAATPHTPPVVGLRRVLHPEPAEGTPLVWRTLKGWEPPPSLEDEAVMANVSREYFRRRVQLAKNKPIGGRDGVLDREQWVRDQFAFWVVDQRTELARASPREEPGDRLTAQAARVEMLRARESQAEEAQRKSAP